MGDVSASPDSRLDSVDMTGAVGFKEAGITPFPGTTAFPPAVMTIHFPGGVIWNFEHHGARNAALQ